jgi:hypothetical protein
MNLARALPFRVFSASPRPLVEDCQLSSYLHVRHRLRTAVQDWVEMGWLGRGGWGLLQGISRRGLLQDYRRDCALILTGGSD